MGMSKTSAQTFGLFLGLAAIVAGAPFLWTIGGSDAKDPGLAIGQPLPALAGTGTVNGPLPSAEDLQGKVVVVNCWATWCPQCHTGMPDLVELHKKYAEQGVVFIGLTGEDESSLEDIQGFVDKYKIEWPNAYGAGESSIALKASYIPRYWVFDRSGKVTWNVSLRDRTELGSAIDKALADKG
jgi:thiol-disulfide isomerase/thioredoxin